MSESAPKDKEKKSKDKEKSKEKSKEKTADKEKKEKKDKKSAEAADAGSPSKEKKEKKDRHGTTEGTSEATGESKDVRVAGSTKYNRHKKKVEKEGKTKTTILWVPEGRLPTDKDVVFQELKEEGGSGVIFVNLADPNNRVWQLPDIAAGTTGSTKTMEASSQVALEKKKFPERKEWKDETAKKDVVKRAKQALTGFLKTNDLTKDEYTIMSGNLAREYMSIFRKVDSEGEKWLSDTAAAQVQEYIARKKEAAAAAVAQEMRTQSLVGKVVEEEGPLPAAPLTTKQIPISPLMTKAFFLKDPYYYRRINVRNSRRTARECQLEDTTFLRPGAGIIKVLCAVPVKLGPSADKSSVAAIVRDWVGAFCMMFIDQEEFVVTSAFPLLEYVEFPMTGYNKLPVLLDDIPLVMTFPNQDAATYFHDSIKIAFCAMYGQGKDDTRIVHMRAYSLEFSSSEISFYPGGTVPDANVVSKKILSQTDRDGAFMDADFFQLRLCMRAPEGRDHVLRAWIRSVDEGTVFKAKSPAMLNNHLRVIEEAIRAPAVHEDSTLAASIIAHLSLLRTDQPETIKNRIEALRTSYRIITPLMEQWKPRSEMPDLPLPECFLPVAGSDAEMHDEVTTAARRRQYGITQVPPGIYLTMLCYCGNSVLCDSVGNLFSEVIVPQPTTVELELFTPACSDFRWILSFGGANENWVGEIAAWKEVYNNAGRQTFRARFLHAAQRLLEAQHFPTLGYVFDAPVAQLPVSCCHVLCVLRIDSKDKVPTNAGEWRAMEEFESQTYLQSLMASHSSRMQFLPSSYYNCVRFVKAAVDYRNSLDFRKEGGFYLGHLVFSQDADGCEVLVPESNRHLVPLTRICSEMPTLEQWRWIQSLNERKRRTRSFGLDTTSPVNEYSTFEQRFGAAVGELENAIGLRIECFYDMEMFVLDELQQLRAVFAVSMIPQTTVVHPQSKRLVPAVPRGTVPMVWKHTDVVEDAYFRLYWPRLFPYLAEERSTSFARAYSTAQPFTLDEAFRLQQPGSLLSYATIDKCIFMISFLRPVCTWVATDERDIVQRYGGQEDDVAAMSVEQAVETATANYSSAQDSTVQTIKSILLESAMKTNLIWSQTRATIQELEENITKGYAERLVSAAPKPPPKKKTRTFDELFGDEEVDDEDGPREATVYELPCSLEELVFKDLSAENANKYFLMQELVQDVVDVAAVDCVDVGEVREVGAIITDMISVIESTDELIDGAALLALKQDTEEAAWQERHDFQRRWLDVFKRDSDSQVLEGAGAGRPGDATRGVSTNAKMDIIEEDEELDNPMCQPLFYDGSTHMISSFNDGVRVCLAKAANSAFQLQQLQRVAASAIEGLELIQCIQEYSACATRRATLLGSDASPITAAPAAPLGPTPQPADSGMPAVVIVSKEFVEFPIVVVDPLRCLVLHGVTGKVRFPTIATASMEVLAAHLRTTDISVPQTLLQFQFDANTCERLLEMSLQMKAPLLALRFATLLFGTPSGPSHFFSGSAALQLRTLVQDGFMFEYGIKDWLHMEVLGGDPIAAAMDVLWWIRFLKEATADAQGTERKDAFGDHEGSWKQVYAETRVRVFLSFGVHALSKDEATLWAQSIGRYVEYLSLRDSSVSDAEIEVLVNCCPNIKSLDVSYTSITSHSIELIVHHLLTLVECSIAGCDVSLQDQDALRRHCTENRRRVAQ